MFQSIAPNNLDRKIILTQSYFEHSLSGYNSYAKILGDRLPPGTSLACAEEVGAEEDSPSAHLVAYRQKGT